MNTNDLKTKQAVLKAVREISKAAFDSKLGNYSINFGVPCSIDMITMSLMSGNDHMYCFSTTYSENLTTWQTSLPLSIDDIPRFHADVEKGLADIFKYVEANNVK